MPSICSAHMGRDPDCELCATDPGDKCDGCGEPMKIGDEIHFAKDMRCFWHVECLPVLTPELLQEWATKT